MSGRTWQDMPEWLVYAVRWQHAEAMEQGIERAGEEAVETLTARIFDKDPEFARIIVARYVRGLVRAPKPRRRGKAGEREQRMADCARMSAEGKSLRAIGEAKGLSHTAVRKILAEWDARLPEMPPALVRAATPLETQAVNPSAGGFTPQVSADPTVIPFRRLA
jgi:hypothetical protein